MKREELPSKIISPITNDELELKEDPNGEVLSVAEFFDTCTECYDPSVAMYVNDTTKEHIYISYE